MRRHGKRPVSTDPLSAYRAKRSADRTPEPAGVLAPSAAGGLFVVHMHAARRLHWDLRLEMDGVLRSWAVPKGPSLDPRQRRLAMEVEDHPLEYANFEGIIPEGEYGGGTVMIWDRGHWQPEGDAHRGMQKGHLDFELDGEKLKGRWHLVRIRKRPNERQEPWLLIKSADKFARKKSDPDILAQKDRSAATGRTMNQIAGDKKRVWHSNRSNGRAPRTVTPPPKSTLKSRAKPEKKESGRKRKSKVPDFIPPSLATLSDKVPDSRNWVHEIKFDGYRMQARIAGGDVTLKTRTGLDWTKRFPTIAVACQRLAAHDLILDGEIVSGNAQGISDFSALQDDLKSGRHDRMVYYVFDLLHVDGADLTGEPLTERRRALEKLVRRLPKDSVIRYSEAFDDGQVLLESADKIGLEGVLSKLRDASYRSGRSGDWLKTKCTDNQEFVIAGYEPSDKKRRAIRSLLLAYYDKRKLRYAGRVGTGWNESKEHDLMRRLAPLATDKPPFESVPEEERRAVPIRAVARGRRIRSARGAATARRQSSTRAGPPSLRRRGPPTRRLRYNADAAVARIDRARPPPAASCPQHSVSSLPASSRRWTLVSVPPPWPTARTASTLPRRAAFR